MYKSSKIPSLQPSTIQTLKALCPHCGNVTHQNLDLTFTEYRIYVCDICNGITFQVVHKVETQRTGQRGKKIIDFQERLEQLWPYPSTLSDEVPERVRKIYEEAISIRTKSPSSFVVQIRRALEAVANERGAPSGTLYNQVEWMIKKNLLPATFGEMIQITRMFGNLGAHDAEKDVDIDDTKVVDEFFRAAIEYIYIAPATIARVKQLLMETMEGT